MSYVILINIELLTITVACYAYLDVDVREIMVGQSQNNPVRSLSSVSFQVQLAVFWAWRYNTYEQYTTHTVDCQYISIQEKVQHNTAFEIYPFLNILAYWRSTFCALAFSIKYISIGFGVFSQLVTERDLPLYTEVLCLNKDLFSWFRLYLHLKINQSTKTTSGLLLVCPWVLSAHSSLSP